MEEKRSFWDYVEQVLVIFGFTMVVMNIFCIAVGDEAENCSTLFSLGNKGISVVTSFQYLGLSALIAFYRMLFFTDMVIKKMGITIRTVVMLATIIISIALFIIVFGWFPVNEWKGWLMFLLCFGISFILSLAFTVLKEKTENRQMEKALEKIKSEEVM